LREDYSRPEGNLKTRGKKIETRKGAIPLSPRTSEGLRIRINMVEKRATGWRDVGRKKNLESIQSAWRDP